MRNYQVGWYTVKILKCVTEPHGILKHHSAQMSESAGRLCDAVNRLYQYSQGIIFRHITKCKSWERYCIPTIVFNPTNMCLVIPLEHIWQSLRRQEEMQLASRCSHTTRRVSWQSVGMPCALKGWKAGVWLLDQERWRVRCKTILTVFEIGSPYETQASLDLQSPYLHPQRSRTTSMCYHAWLG